jgi:prepilin-type N-terminal cleavage/methylation domain-containing protein
MPHPKAPTSTLGPPTSASAVDISWWHGRPARDLRRFSNHGRAARATTDNQSPASNSRPTFRMFVPSRPGFTLIELLVVIGILVVLASIGYGAILSTRRQEAHRAVTALVSDFIRQARHTAMSSGAPVEAVIFDDEGKGRIRGFTQVTIVGEQFEAITLAPNQQVPGHSGYGCAIGRTNPNDASSPATFDPFDIPSSASQPIAILLKPSTTSTGPTSFYLECSVCPLPTVWQYPLATPDNRPLIAVSLMEGSSQIVSIGLAPIDGISQNKTAISNWRYVVYSDPPSSPIVYPNMTFSSGTWVRLGILWSGDELTLSFDGRQMPPVSFPLTINDFTSLKLSIGGGDPTQPTISAGIVDNVRLYRLGGGEDFPLPAGFVPYQDYRLQFSPEGSVTGNQNLVFHSEKTGRTEEIGITITGPGSLSSTTATFDSP